MYEPLEHAPAAFIELGEQYPDMTESALRSLYYEGVGAWLLWGTEGCPTATNEQRQNIIKAILLIETHGGMDAIGGEREKRAIEAQQFWLDNMSGEGLARHCQRVLDETIKEEKELSAYLLTLKRRPGPKIGQTGFAKADAALFSKVDNLIAAGATSPWAACMELAKAGEIPGRNGRAFNFENRARRLYSAYQESKKRNSM